MTKTCSTCHVDKPLEAYDKRSVSKDGRVARCKECTLAVRAPLREKAAKRSRDWHAANRDQAVERSRRYHADHRDENNAKRQAWAMAHPEHTAATAERFYRNNREERKRYAREHHAQFPEKTRLHNQNRKARKRGAWGRVTLAALNAILDKQGGKCANPYCGADLTETPRQLDHWIPLSKGGLQEVDNLKWLCAPCNQHKKAKMPEVWLAAQAATHGV